MAKKYTVVTKESDLPSDARYAGHSYTSWNGFTLVIETRQIERDRIKITYRYYDGPQAPSSQSVQYEWAAGTQWKIAAKSAMIIY